MAPLSHRAYAASVPARGLDVLPADQPAFRGCGAVGNERNKVAGAAGTGLSLCVAGADGKRGAARRARSRLLAYPVAERGGIWNLPLATGVGGRFAWRGSCRFPHSNTLQQFSADGGSGRRSIDRLGQL